MICFRENCRKQAVEFHGMTLSYQPTHGYCHKHRCCAACGLSLDEHCQCDHPVERTTQTRQRILEIHERNNRSILNVWRLFA